MDLYIYYKVDPVAAEELAPRVTAMQAALAASHNADAAIRRRPGEQNGLQTWMEVYLDVPAGFDAVLFEAVTGSGVATLISGQRHTEIFVDIDACA